MGIYIAGWSMSVACYENLPMTVVEAYACGTPTIVAGLGALQEMVADKRTGMHFLPGNAEDLACKVEWAWIDPGEMDEIGLAGRAEFLVKDAADRNYEMLMGIKINAQSNRAKGSGLRCPVN